MATVVREIGIDVAAGTCWDAVRDFGALGERLAPGFVTDVQMVGARERQVTFFTGSVAREYLVGSDDAMMRLAYAVTESPLGSSHMNAAVQVIADGDARCRFVWITDVLPDELADRVAALMDRGLDAIKTTLQTAATRASDKGLTAEQLGALLSAGSSGCHQRAAMSCGGTDGLLQRRRARRADRGSA